MMILSDFCDPSEALRWRSTDDVVMGGCSASSLSRQGDLGVFAGHVSLENGGGFAAVRRCDSSVDLSEYSAVELRVRGDGQRYKLSARTSDSAPGVAFHHAFETEAGRWCVVRLPFDAFVPRRRGRDLSASFGLTHVTSLGLLIADRQAGPFRLELESIRARL